MKGSYDLDELQTNQLLREAIDVGSIALLTNTNRDDEHENSCTFDSIDDPVPLPDGANAAVASKLSGQEFALGFRVGSQPVDAITDFSLNALIGNSR